MLNSYVEDIDDGLSEIQNVGINLKQEFNDEDIMYLHDVIVLDTMKELVYSNKENVLNWDVFDYRDEMDDILIEKPEFEEKMRINYGTRVTSSF